MVERKELDARMYRLRGYFGIAKTAYREEISCEHIKQTNEVKMGPCTRLQTVTYQE